MNKNIEKEYKILVNEEQFYDLLKQYPDAVFHKQVNTYYDTADMMIHHAKGAMRIREIDSKYIFTLKLHRSEGLLEYECETFHNNADVFYNNAQIKKLLDQHRLYGKFHQITSLTTQRAMIVNEYAELCFDINDYNGLRDYEIEYEYKKDHNGREVFNTILSNIKLTYTHNCPSKIKRALDSSL